MDLYAQTTGAFLAEAGVQVAVNGSFYEPFRPGFLLGIASEPNRGDPVNVKGLSISDGKTYSEDYPELPVLCLTDDRAEIRGDGCPAGTRQALAGNPVVVEHGAALVHERTSYHREPHPRTAVAVDAEGQTLWLIVVDGRQADYSEGVTLAELADFALELGAETALNLDGGGSSTMVAEGADGPYLLNAPIHTRLAMRERPVANHLGVYALPLGEAGPWSSD
jgi:exopolysaccharide biosynthesis protein